MPKTKKRRFGSIEMTEIPRNKRLGRKTLKKSRVPIYRMRVKKSVCRKKKREVCVKSCKYTRGRIRKYCRKRRNESVRF